uniref:G_PROTEIN_RECEP_F1_2 domain-containing protein n=1 Tax=Gongylonema pulchrum TaxID=637853 RepID=A0A183D5V3_9BILA
LDNTLIYVVVLSCVDFGVCVSLPFTVIDQILGFWMFGTVICKFHAVLENFGKILSSLIITAMSFDRYVSVCHTQKNFLRSRRLAVSILIGHFYAISLILKIKHFRLCLIWLALQSPVCLLEKKCFLKNLVAAD